MGYAEQIAKNFSSSFFPGVAALERRSYTHGAPKRRIIHESELSLISGFLQDFVVRAVSAGFIQRQALRNLIRRL
jgi:hypothetical protein